ncbi:class I SAM-dependent methyltransferase [Streptomyces sp. ARC12]|uniref:O-methyltransferase n=2 Tax=Streptomycetaceae TaxID=2062 RepID=UPI000BFBB701|nr:MULTISPECIES: class I SAM-dependent methyltransferase [unclassified Streptomyces]MBT1105106.1 class I SAM-dependent methyltransferase [Streptomyces sp. Tu10]WTC65327.1 class I SAM-dependent methyltransferase [Streptomyces anulatus]WTC71646.1 class I SAM-dependent methyltransferase [Streptomyces anulatus]
MDDRPYFRPAALDHLLADAAGLGFTMSCEDRTGSLLATLAASKPGGHMVELGTGVGAGASWLLHGMRADAHLTSVETDLAYQAVAADHLGHDTRVSFVTADAEAWLDSYAGPPLALAYVDCRPGKFHRLDDLVGLLEPGGLYVVDDLLPQRTWPSDHQARVDGFLAHLPERSNMLGTAVTWASGLLVGTRI